MKMVVKNGDRTKSVTLHNKEENTFTVSIDDKEYILDIVKVERGVYSILYNGKSINMEMIEGDEIGKYKVNTFCEHLELDVVPLASLAAKSKSVSMDSEEIKAPMSGKIVRVKVQEGDKIKEGDPLVILSAMKMENEIKSSISGIVSKISVNEDELVKDGELMISIKAENNEVD